MLKLEKRPEEIVIEAQGGKFYFEPVSWLDLFELGTQFETESASSMEAFRKQCQYVFSRLKRVEDVEYVDGSQVKELQLTQCPQDLAMEIVTSYFQEISRAFPKTAEAGEKNGRNSLNGCSSPD